MSEYDTFGALVQVLVTEEPEFQKWFFLFKINIFGYKPLDICINLPVPTKKSKINTKKRSICFFIICHFSVGTNENI